MFDTDGNQRVDKDEFLVVRTIKLEDKLFLGANAIRKPPHIDSN